MQGYKSNLEKVTEANTNFRQVLYTSEYMQLVLMTLKPGEEIGVETHDEGDQFFRFESGEGLVTINGVEHSVGAGDAVIIPQGAEHNVVNVSDTLPLKLYTIYTPPHHKDGIVRATRQEAVADAPEFDGVTSEV